MAQWVRGSENNDTGLLLSADFLVVMCPFLDYMNHCPNGEGVSRDVK